MANKIFAVVWGLMTIIAFISMFYNPFHAVTTGACALMFWAHISENEQ